MSCVTISGGFPIAFKGELFFPFVVLRFGCRSKILGSVAEEPERSSTRRIAKQLQLYIAAYVEEASAALRKLPTRKQIQIARWVVSRFIECDRCHRIMVVAYDAAHVTCYLLWPTHVVGTTRPSWPGSVPQPRRPRDCASWRRASRLFPTATCPVRCLARGSLRRGSDTAYVVILSVIVGRFDHQGVSFLCLSCFCGEFSHSLLGDFPPRNSIFFGLQLSSAIIASLEPS